MDILGLGLPVTKTQYFDGLKGPTDIGGDDTIMWFDWTDKSTVVYVPSGNIESISNKVTVTPWSTHILASVGGTPTLNTVGGQNNLSYSNHLGEDNHISYMIQEVVRFQLTMVKIIH